MPVVFVILDGVGSRMVTGMPTLRRWAESGAWHPEGSRAVLCSATYPNHATFVTGRGPDTHGIWTNDVPSGDGILPAEKVGPGTDTIFTRLESAEAILGDQHLVGVMGAGAARSHWPPGGVIPAGTATDPFGYVSDEEVLKHASAAWERNPDALVVHLNSPDTAAHAFGPHSPEARDAYDRVDDILARLGELVAPRREETVLLVTSDHDQEPADPDRRVDLAALARHRGVDAVIVPEGSAALVAGRVAESTGWFEAVDGIEGSLLVAPDRRLLFSSPGAWFASADAPPRRGVHGGPRCRGQVAVAAGDHPFVADIAAAWARRAPTATRWAALVEAAVAATGGRSRAPRRA